MKTKLDLSTLIKYLEYILFAIVFHTLIVGDDFVVMLSAAAIGSYIFCETSDLKDYNDKILGQLNEINKNFDYKIDLEGCAIGSFIYEHRDDVSINKELCFKLGINALGRNAVIISELDRLYQVEHSANND